MAEPRSNGLSTALLARWVKSLRPGLANTIGAAALHHNANVCTRLQTQYQGLRSAFHQHTTGRLICCIAATMCDSLDPNDVADVARECVERSWFPHVERALALLPMALLVHRGADRSFVLAKANAQSSSTQREGNARLLSLLSLAIAGAPSDRRRAFNEAEKYSGASDDEGERMQALVVKATAASPDQASAVIEDASEVIDSGRYIGRYGLDEGFAALGALALAASVTGRVREIPPALAKLERLATARGNSRIARGLNKGDCALWSALALTVLVTRSRH